MRVDPSNADALRSWDGDDGARWTEYDDIFDGCLARYNDALLDGLRPNDHVLDVGCGTGSITRAAARRAKTATGIDLSSQMLALAEHRAKADGLDNVHFVHGDAQVHEFEQGSFDAIVSRAGVMFFGDPVAAFTNLRRALRPGGRLTALVWQPLAANEWMTALLSTINATTPTTNTGAFSLADPADAQHLLAAAGFTATTVTGIREPMSFGPDPARAYDFFAGLGPVRAALAGSRIETEQRLRALLAAHTAADGILLGSAMWLVEASIREKSVPAHT
jgi:ubiquinone/menaquinone biosynthesis C-methylase UbiE